MKAVIMAGGAGTRLRPLTSNQPKPMVPLANRPLMEHIVLLCKQHGFEDLVVTVQFLASLVRQYFGNGEDFGVQLTYATEESPLGTAGSVKNAESALGEPFLVVSGDALTDIDLERVAAFHTEKKALVTVVLSRQPNPLEYGIVIADRTGRIERFLEKPGWGQVFSDTVNTGIYVLDPEIFSHIPEDQPFDFSRDLFPILMEKGAPMFGYVADGYWTDVGTIDAYMQAHHDVLDGKVKIEIPGFEIADRVWVGDGAIIDPDARIEGPALLGEHAKVEAGAHLREYTVLGNNAVVKEGAFLQRSVVHDNAYVGPGANLRGTLIGRNADVRRNARLEEGVVVGDEGFVGVDAVLQPNVKVYPFKTVEAGAVIARSIVWESRGARTLFGAQGVGGLINVDITPDLAVRLAMAYATTLKRGSTVVTSRDASRAARTIKRAFIAGLNGAGVHVHDLEVAPVPVTRYHLRSARATGGVTVATAPGDPQSIELRFLGPDGTEIDESVQRSIERVYYREDYRRAFPDEIGELRFPPRALEFYQAGLVSTLDLARIHTARVKTVVDCAFGATAIVLPGILGRLGSDVLTVNSYLDETRPTLSDEQTKAHVDQLTALVKASRARLGIFMDPLGERVSLVDETGDAIPQDEALLLLTYLSCRANPGGTVVVPISATSAVELVANEFDSPVLRTKLSAGSLMAATSESGAIFGGTEDGAYIFGAFSPAFDALNTFCRVLEFLADGTDGLASLRSKLPSAHVLHRTVRTPWEKKGSVMRHVATTARGDRTQDTEGLKVFHGEDWALVVPDPEDPITHVWAEGRSLDASERWAARYIGLIEQAIE
ncbi:MAG: sugar phosphate nucleotidyltransferase [Actinomycetota bacterium]|nr:mannose-1-phosphate guanyltransferase [Actinomycetota bacterium]